MTTPTTTATDLPNVPHPAGASKVHDWDQIRVGGPTGYWRGSPWRIDRYDVQSGAKDVEVFIDGIQHHDGRVERYVHVYEMHPDLLVTNDQVRQVAAAMIAAVDESEAADDIDGNHTNQPPV
jgi:hypothetical protein